jgi:hypothetical protein
MKLTDITGLNDIQARLEAITPAQMQAMDRRSLPLDNETDQRIGVITSESSRALFTLASLLIAEHETEDALSHIVIEVEEEEDHNNRSVLARELADVVRELQWFQMRSELGFWKAANIGIRKGWILVEELDEGDWE